MIVCKRCGHRNNEGENFCASCGAFLEWNSERVSPPPEAPKPVAAPPPPPASEPTILERVKHAVGLEEAHSTRDHPAVPPASPEQPTSSIAQPVVSASSPTASAARDSTASSGGPQPVAQAPPRPGTAFAPVPTSQVANGSGDLICAQCGLDNPPSRRFCRRCGTSLLVTEGVKADPVKAESVLMSWWRRIFPPRHVPGVSQGQPAATVAPSAPETAASATTTPTDDGFMKARIPQAVAPGPSHPRKAPRPQPPPGERYNPGDLICGQCGLGNNPSRRFCRRCGNPLAEAQVVATPWWRRIIPARAAPRAGTRPGAVRRNIDGSGFGAAAKLVAKTLIALILAGVVVVLVVSPDTRSRLSHRVATTAMDLQRQIGIGEGIPVRPESVHGSSEAIGHQAQFLIDPSAGYWATDTAGDPQPVLSLNFSEPTDLDYMMFTSGAAGGDFAKIGRPRELLVTYSPGGSTERVQLSDDQKPVRYRLHGTHVSSIQIQILSVNRSDQSTLVAISEVDLLRLKPIIPG
jgi:predicted amidophosphoribosyltransferase